MAKVLIDIPDRIHYGITNGFTVNGSEASQIVLEAVKDGIVLDGLTNGEVIQKMFPEALVTRHYIGCDSIATISLHFKSITGYEMAFSESWWNRKWGE